MVKRNLDLLLEDFEEFCTNDIISGKAKSYKHAIRYLCDFLNITSINESELETIKNAKDSLKNVNSKTYIDCLEFLKSRNQSSYLLKGFINSAISHFSVFMK